MFIDVHCHLDLNKDAEGAVERARRGGVEIIITNGIDIAGNRKVLELAGEYKEVKAALGIYPIEGLKLSDEEIDEEINFIRKNSGKIAAIGEVGLDFKENYDTHSKENQIKNFRKFISLSLELDKPIIVHTRKAEKECIEILKEMVIRKVILHCFFGKTSLIDEAIELGWSFSIPTSVCYNEQMQELAKRVPVSQVFCETDSPFMHPFREKNNEPALVAEGYKKIAELKGIGVKELEKQVEKNYKFLFSRR